jgi:hypothetical protein
VVADESVDHFSGVTGCSDWVLVAVDRPLLNSDAGSLITVMRRAALEPNWPEIRLQQVRNKPEIGWSFASLEKRWTGSVVAMSPSPRLVAVGLLLLGACSGIPVPGESPEQFFTRCMAGFGYEVFDVTTGGTLENCCGFATEAEPTAAFDRAMFECEDTVVERFG